jgi:hypothetical protein
MVRRGFHFQPQEISAMTTYTAKFSSVTLWATREIEAETPEQALHLAREIADHEAGALDWCAYDPSDDVEEIEIDDEDGTTEALWQSDDLRLRLAAADLLVALEVALERLELGNYAGEEDAYIAQARAAIGQATGGAA